MMKRRPTGPQVDVNVGQETIELSMPKNSSHCMIAEAIKTSYPRASHVAVDISTIRFTDPEKRQRYTFLTPRRAQVALLQFDQGIKPDPFQFQLKRAHVTVSGTKKEGDVSAPKERKPRATLIGAGSNGERARRFGGKTPPRLPHTRREFGIRAFGHIAALAVED